MRIRPILFNTDMVRAILDGRKTATRRAVKYKYSNTEMKMHTDKYGTHLIEIQKDIEGETHGKNPDGSTWHKLLPYIYKIPSYKKGDILYVRETWSKKRSSKCIGNKTEKCPYESCENAPGPCLYNEYIYKATDNLESNDVTWHPSIHMPKEAARIWLKVLDVRVERLQDIKNVYNEGIHFCDCPAGYTWKDTTDMHNCYTDPVGAMKALWNSTIPKGQQDLYSWAANPWVWVIEFERCEKAEAAGEEG